MLIVSHEHSRRGSAGFSLVEMLVVIAVIAIISAVLLPYVSPMRRASSDQIARQQQAELQTALGSWIAATSSGPGGLAAAREAYSQSSSKLGLLQNYLQPATYAAFGGSGNNVTSAVLSAAGTSLQFSSWGVGGYPSVNWQ
ncbi:MAG: type II secretion system protein [Chthoniobacterales bacterium]|jgi:prepilin-type N-terminal cleavage/methylation domain-containing protein|nr:type II secretion system protein [Chthoniobacterales bacterium]